MNVEILSVGTELLMGEITNTNAVYLMRFCREMGFNVYFQSTVGDNPERLKETLNLAFQRGADMIITTGGIGPTNDDLTKQVSAEVLGLPMIYWPSEAKKIEEKVSFLTGKKEIAQSNYQQAYYPADAYILENDVGTANGCVMENKNRRIVNLPGPPREMQYVVDHALREYFTAFASDRLEVLEFVVLGTGESQLADELAELLACQQEVTIALYAQEGYVRIRLATKASQVDLLSVWEEKLRMILQDRLRPMSDLNTLWIAEMPSFSLCLDDQCDFLHDFFYQEDFKDKLDPLSEHHLDIHVESYPMGEKLCLDYLLYGQHFTTQIPSLKAARYAVAKNKQKIRQFMQSCYTSIANKENEAV